jgi:hypothetical protein
LQAPSPPERRLPRGITLADVASTVIDVADEDWEVTAVVVRMLRNGSIRLRPGAGL